MSDNVKDPEDWALKQEEDLIDFKRSVVLSRTMFIELMNVAGKFIEENRPAYDWEENVDDVIRVADMMLRIMEFNRAT